MTIRDALHEFGSRANRTWEHDRSLTVGASEVGRCLRATWFSKHGTGKDEGYVETFGYTLRGSVCEAEFFVPAMRAKYGKRFRYGGDAQKTFIDPPLSATPDGLLRDVTPAECAEWGIPQTDCVLVEFKNIGSYRLSEAPKPDHEFQVQTQLGLVRAAGRYQPSAAILIYVSAFNWQETREFPILFDPAVFKQAQLRAAKVFDARRPQSIPAEGRLSGGNECRWCAFRETCSHIELSRDLRDSALLADAERPAA